MKCIEESFAAFIPFDDQPFPERRRLMGSDGRRSEDALA